MAKKKTEEVKRNDINTVCLTGTIKKINYTSDKIASYNLDIATTTPKGNTAHTWVDIIDFVRDTDFEEGDYVKVSGHVMTQSYENNGKKVYKVVVCADEMDVIPFE